MLAVLKESLRLRERSEKVLWIFLLLFVFSISFSIAVSHIFLTISALVYLYRKFKHHRTMPRPPILVPALAFAYFTLLSVVFSIHPSLSLIDAKDLALFIIIPIFYEAVRDLEDIRVIYGILILAGVISAAYGLYQFTGSE